MFLVVRVWPRRQGKVGRSAKKGKRRRGKTKCSKNAWRSFMDGPTRFGEMLWEEINIGTCEGR